MSGFSNTPSAHLALGASVVPLWGYLIKNHCRHVFTVLGQVFLSLFLVGWFCLFLVGCKTYTVCCYRSGGEDLANTRKASHGARRNPITGEISLSRAETASDMSTLG